MMTVLCLLSWVVFNAAPTVAPAAAAGDESPPFAARIGVDLGGAYESNVLGNASQISDYAGLARWALDADYVPSRAVILKLAYRGDLSLYRDVAGERSLADSVELTLGVRPLETLYVSLTAGGQHDYHPDRPAYTFAGGFGRAAARLELGDSLTARALYQLRYDVFPDYDLDNASHRAEAALLWAAGDHVELDLPVSVELTRYAERFLLDAASLPTATHRTGRRFVAEPRLHVLPSFGTRFTFSVRGEHNDSSDTYYYVGPFGVADPRSDPEIVAHFDSHRSLTVGLDAILEPLDPLFLCVRIHGGGRRFTAREAFDTFGRPSGELQRDTWVEPSVKLRWRLARHIALGALYEYVRQWSNDPVFDFDAHVVELTTTITLGD